MTLESLHRQFSSQYDSRVVFYERKMFIRLATGPGSSPLQSYFAGSKTPIVALFRIFFLLSDPFGRCAGVKFSFSPPTYGSNLSRDIVTVMIPLRDSPKQCSKSFPS